MQGHLSPLSGVACLGERFVATVGHDNQVIVWDARSRRAIARAFHDHGVNGCAFSPDGRLLATASGDRTARLWRVPDLRLVAVFHDHGDDVEAVAFSPDGRHVATASRDGNVRVFDLEGRLLRVLPGHTALASVGWCDGGASLVSTSEGGVVQVWSAAEGELLRTVDLREPASALPVVTPDGSILWVDGDGDLRVIADGIAHRHPVGAPVERLAFDAVRRRLVTLSVDRSVRLWTLDARWSPTLLDVTRAPAVVSLHALAFDGAGRLVVGTYGSSFAVYDPSSREWEAAHVRDTPGLHAALQTREGIYTVGDAGVVRLNGRLFTRLPSRCDFLVAWEGRVYAGGPTGELFEARTGERVFAAGSPLLCATVVQRRGAAALVVGSRAGEGLVFERVGVEVRFVAQVKLHAAAVTALASDDEAIFSVSADGDAAWHDAEALAPIRVLERAHERAALGAARLSEGAFVSVSRDLSLRLWFADGTTERVRTPHGRAVTCVAVCPETRRVATASHDGRVAVWSVDEGRWLTGDRPTSSGIASLARGASPGEFIAASHDGAVYRLGREGHAAVAVPASRDTTGWTHTQAPRRDGTRVPVLRDRISEVSL